MASIARALFVVGVIGAAASLVGCDSDDDGFVERKPGSYGPIDSVIVSFPYNDAIVDLENGWYRRKAAVALTDREGRPVPKGTTVTMRIVDTIIAEGVISATNVDTISEKALHIPGARYSDGTSINDLTTAYVMRRGLGTGAIRMIESGDTVLLNSSRAHNKDIVRSVAARPSMVDSLNVSQRYNVIYPDYLSEVFPERIDGTEYKIGASMLGAGVLGEDEDGNLTPGEVRVTSSDGIAVVWFRYPTKQLMAGCGNSQVDSRAEPLGSSQVYLTVQADGIMNYQPFCFAGIAGYSMTVPFDSLVVMNSGDSLTAPAAICVRDGSNVPVPFAHIAGFMSESDGAVVNDVVASDVSSGGTYFTNEAGCFTPVFNNVTGGSETSLTWRFMVGDADVDVEITVLNGAGE